MGWVKFQKASQAVTGIRMRPEPTFKRPGRRKGHVVSHREQRPHLGNIIVFTDGNYVKTSEAKLWWLVEAD